LLDFHLSDPLTSDEILLPSKTLSLSGQEFSDFDFEVLTQISPGSYTLIDAGTIVGSLGTHPRGIIDGRDAIISVVGNDVVLNVVPEPSSLTLFAAALVSLIACGWRMWQNTAGCSAIVRKER
jgi:hypothetical protein